MSQFARILKQLRTQAKLTQPELADKSGVSKGTIADLEQNRYEPTWVTVQALAKALGVTCEAFTVKAKPSKKAGRGRPKEG